VIRVEKYNAAFTSLICTECGCVPTYVVKLGGLPLPICEEHLTQLGVAIVDCGLRDVRIARTRSLRFEPIGDEFTDE